MADNPEQIRLAVKEILREEGIQAARTFLFNKYGYDKAQADEYLISKQRFDTEDDIKAFDDTNPIFPEASSVVSSYDIIAKNHKGDPDNCPVCLSVEKTNKPGFFSRIFSRFKG